MRIVRDFVYLGLFFCCLLFVHVDLYGQLFGFRHYNTEDNLPNSFVYAINQDDNGYLWLSTGNGLSRFNGQEFYDVVYPDSLDNRYATTSTKDRFGNIWFGSDDGIVYKINNNIPVEIDINNNKSISSLIEGPDGFIWVITQGESIFRINPTSPEHVESFEIENSMAVFSGIFNSGGELMIGTQDNIQIYRHEGDFLILTGSVEGFDYAGVHAIYQLDNDEYIVGTNGSGLFHLQIDEEGSSLSHFEDFPELDYLSVQSFFIDQESSLWVSTSSSGAYRIVFDNGSVIESITRYERESGLAGDNVKTVFQDAEGNYWFGLSGDGLSLMNSMAYTFFSPGTIPGTKNIIAIDQIDDLIFLGTPVGYYLYDADHNELDSLTNLQNGVGNSEITSYFVDESGNIWIGTDGNGLFVKMKSGSVRQFYRSGNTSEDYISDIAINDGRIWLGSLNGVILLERETGRFIDRFNIDNGLPHNNIENIFITEEGNCAVSLKSDRLFVVDVDGEISSLGPPMYGTTINTVLSSTQDSFGRFWAATSGNGIFNIMSDSIVSFGRSEMLLSDYCYSIKVDDFDRVWVGHDRGFSRYDITRGVMKTFGSEFAGSGVCNKNAIFESDDHHLYIGTTQGFVVYDKNKDNNESLAPANNIDYLVINNVVYPALDSYVLPYEKHYIIRIHYSGINLKDPEKVYYQTRLINWVDDWSDWSNETEVVYSPRDGHYVFEMNSVNEDGLSSEAIVFNLVIKKPVWRTWWFLLTVIFVITGIVYIIIREREKTQKKIEEYLKTELNARTREVHKQKEEIELQNLEITDSINYAKKIQTSILPDFNKLKDTFKDAFIFFRPRDIVSGDFYWFDKVRKDKFVLVCADSTGHGVPGAFMSMIGATLLQDIVTRQQITKPSEILKKLDEHIFATLNQNLEFGVTNDGMDMVVCEFDISTNHLRFASAMRPVILYVGGESLYLRGNRFSVGGESGSEKFFDDQEFVMNEGDSIYLFSDGFPDQFGGVNNKKLKIFQLKRLLEDIYSLPMDEQHEVVSKFFYEWKGDNEQVDDILLIGLRF